jgi:CBS domain-containing protein
MNVRELMTPFPEVCLATDSCAAVGEAMRRRGCGYIPIVESRATQRVIGVVTDRDLALYLVRANQPAGDLTVEACMTKQPRTIAPDAELEEAARIMEELAVHRLPVVQDGRLVGVLSLKDLAMAARRQWATAGPHMVERQLTEIIEAIAAAQLGVAQDTGTKSLGGL